MKIEPLDVEGKTLAQYINSLPEELQRDAVGFWQFDPVGRIEFNLVGDDLVDFVRRVIHALLDAGAVPVRFGGGTGFDWVVQKQYGTDKTGVTEAIIAEPDYPDVSAPVVDC